MKVMTANTNTSAAPRRRPPLFKGWLAIVIGIAIALLLLGVGSLGTIIMQHVMNAGREEVTVVGFKDWRVICPPVNEKKTNCVLNMDVMRQQGDTLLRFSVTQTDTNPALAVIVPHGVLLDQGVGLSFTGSDMKVRPIETCDNIGCLANMVLDEQTLTAMKTNAKGQIVVVPGNGKPVAIPFSLNGFADGYAELQSAESSRAFWSFLD
jgi:invasion protein IalB